MKNILILSALFLASCTKNQYTTNVVEQKECQCEYAVDTSARNMNYKEVQLEGTWRLTDNEVLRLRHEALADGYYKGESSLGHPDNLAPIRWKYDFQLKRFLVSDLCGDSVQQIRDIQLRKDSITIQVDDKVLVLNRVI